MFIPFISIILAFSSPERVSAPAKSSPIVSDLDDTLKMTNVPNLLPMLFNGLFRDSVFAGIPELLRQLRGPEGSLHVISGSPEALREKITHGLYENQILDFQLSLRDWGQKEDIETYKLGVLRKTIKSPSILMGDDTEKDASIYLSFQKDSPELVKAIYIHRVTGKSLPDGVKTWLTGFDIAYQEFQAHRMSESSVRLVADAVLASKFSHIVPLYGSFGCSDESARACGKTQSPVVESACQRVQKKVAQICELWKRDRMKFSSAFNKPPMIRSSLLNSTW